MFIYFSKKDLFLFTFVLTFCNTSAIHWQMNRDYFVLTSYCSPYHSDLLLRVRLVLLNCYSDKLLFMDFLLFLVLLLSLLAALLPLVWLVIWTWLHNKILETRFWRIVLLFLLTSCYWKYNKSSLCSKNETTYALCIVCSPQDFWFLCWKVGFVIEG